MVQSILMFVTVFLAIFYLGKRGYNSFIKKDENPKGCLSDCNCEDKLKTRP